MSEPLLPCPFCGNIPEWDGYEPKNHEFICRTCDLWGIRPEWWNRRTPAAADLVRELRDALGLCHALLLKAYLFKGYSNGPLQEPATQMVLGQAETAIARADAHPEGREPQNYSAAQWIERCYDAVIHSAEQIKMPDGRKLADWVTLMNRLRDGYIADLGKIV